jgi:ribosome assembly protein SQT1
VTACSFGGKEHLYLASSSSDGTVRLWQALAGVVVAAFRGHHGEVLAASLGVDGPQVLSAGEQ